MKRHAERAASVLLVASALAAPALAGDRALIDLIGFSEDGVFFAFEEFGIQDGSGFPYSTIYVVDAQADRWVDGTPFRVRLDSEQATLADARTENAETARPLLEHLAITVPAEFVALNGDGDLEATPNALRFGWPGYGLADPMFPVTVGLETFDATSPLPCADWSFGPTRGVRLTITDELGTRTIHTDKRLPESRGCALDYRLYGIVMPMWQMEVPSMAIVSVYAGGFEGPDRRFMAVPLAR